MKKPIPAGFRCVESGHTTDTPPLRFTPTATSNEEALDKPDKTRDAIVVYLQDDEKITAGQMGLPMPNYDPERGFCLHRSDARRLCIDLLHHLAGIEERVAVKIIDRLDEIRTELEIEDSTRDTEE